MIELEYITRDGLPDPDFERTKHVEAVKSSFKQLGQNVLSGLGNAAMRALDELDLAVYDSGHGTDLLKQYRAKRLAERTNFVAKQYELV